MSAACPSPAQLINQKYLLASSDCCGQRTSGARLIRLCPRPIRECWMWSWVEARERGCVWVSIDLGYMSIKMDRGHIRPLFTKKDPPLVVGMNSWNWSIENKQTAARLTAAAGAAWWRKSCRRLEPVSRWSVGVLTDSQNTLTINCLEGGSLSRCDGVQVEIVDICVAFWPQ